MIQKMNGISFKGIYPMQSMQNIDMENLFKLMPVIKMEEDFPHNDIFLGMTPNNKLLIEVREKDFSTELLTEDVLNAAGDLTTKQLVGLTAFIQKLKYTYHANHPERSYTTHTENTINRMSMFDMAAAVNNAVQTFNKKFNNRPN